jgi:type III restriction enzyme
VAQSQTTNTELQIDLSKKDWYVFNDNYGTSEEKYLVKYIDKTYDALKNKYDEVYLIRNEKHFQLFNFDDGTPVEPDFVLFLKKKEPGLSVHYQIFIEPKGSHLLQQDAWKQSFLLSLKKKNKIHILDKTKKYNIWGMPFYNETLTKSDFENAFKEIIRDASLSRPGTGAFGGGLERHITRGTRFVAALPRLATFCLRCATANVGLPGNDSRLAKKYTL